MKLTDFGLVAKVQQDVNSGSSSDLELDHEEEGKQVKMDAKIVGTPDYISPEVIKGKPVSFSMDYWALGIIYY